MDCFNLLFSTPPPAESSIIVDEKPSKVSIELDSSTSSNSTTSTNSSIPLPAPPSPTLDPDKIATPFDNIDVMPPTPPPTLTSNSSKQRTTPSSQRPDTSSSTSTNPSSPSPQTTYTRSLAAKDAEKAAWLRRRIQRLNQFIDDKNRRCEVIERYRKSTPSQPFLRWAGHVYERYVINAEDRTPEDVALPDTDDEEEEETYDYSKPYADEHAGDEGYEAGVSKSPAVNLLPRSRAPSHWRRCGIYSARPASSSNMAGEQARPHTINTAYPIREISVGSSIYSTSAHPNPHTIPYPPPHRFSHSPSTASHVPGPSPTSPTSSSSNPTSSASVSNSASPTTPPATPMVAHREGIASTKAIVTHQQTQNVQGSVLDRGRPNKDSRKRRMSGPLEQMGRSLRREREGVE